MSQETGVEPKRNGLTNRRRLGYRAMCDDTCRQSRGVGEVDRHDVRCADRHERVIARQHQELLNELRDFRHFDELTRG